MGEIVRVEKEQQVPADMLLVHSSNASGTVFADTTDLDGENYLKKRKVHRELAKLGLEGICKTQGQVVCSQPNENLEEFAGSIDIVDRDEISGLTINNMVLRQSRVKNTKFCVGIVLYVGEDTKIMKNKPHLPTKKSKMIKLLNKVLFAIIGIQLILVILFSGLGEQWANNDLKGEDHYYLGDLDPFYIRMLKLWVSYSHMIPISLYLALDIIKTV